LRKDARSRRRWIPWPWIDDLPAPEVGDHDDCESTVREVVQELSATGALADFRYSVAAILFLKGRSARRIRKEVGLCRSDWDQLRDAVRAAARRIGLVPRGRGDQE